MEKTARHFSIWKLILAFAIAFSFSGIVSLAIRTTLGITVLRCQTCGKGCACPVVLGGPKCLCAK